MPIKVFISYKHQDESRNQWVEDLYRDLRSARIDAKLDKYEVPPGESFSDYMTREIRQCDYVLFIVTPAAVKAVGSGSGALAFEMQISNARRLASKDGFRIIPIFREGEATSTYLSDHRYLDFRNDDEYDFILAELLQWLLGNIQAPKLGKSARSESKHEDDASPSANELDLLFTTLAISPNQSHEISSLVRSIHQGMTKGEEQAARQRLERLGDFSVDLVRTLFLSTEPTASEKGALLLTLLPEYRALVLLRSVIMGPKRLAVAETLKNAGEAPAKLLVHLLAKGNAQPFFDACMQTLIAIGQSAVPAVMAGLRQETHSIHSDLIKILAMIADPKAPQDTAIDALRQISYGKEFTLQTKYKAKKKLILLDRSHTQETSLQRRFSQRPLPAPQAQPESPSTVTKRRTDPTLLQKIHVERGKGQLVTTTDLAKEFSVKPATIRRWAKALGVKPKYKTTIMYFDLDQAEIIRKWYASRRRNRNK